MPSSGQNFAQNIYRLFRHNKTGFRCFPRWIFQFQCLQLWVFMVVFRKRRFEYSKQKLIKWKWLWFRSGNVNDYRSLFTRDYNSIDAFVVQLENSLLISRWLNAGKWKQTRRFQTREVTLSQHTWDRVLKPRMFCKRILSSSVISSFNKTKFEQLKLNKLFPTLAVGSRQLCGRWKTLHKSLTAAKCAAQHQLLSKYFSPFLYMIDENIEKKFHVTVFKKNRVQHRPRWNRKERKLKSFCRRRFMNETFRIHKDFNAWMWEKILKNDKCKLHSVVCWYRKFEHI